VCVAHDGEKSLARARVVEAPDGRSQAVLRSADSDLPRRDLLDRVGLVENNEVVRKKETTLALLLFVRGAKEHEEQGVVQHDHVRGEKSFARLLVKAARILPACFLGAKVRFAANLRPNFRVGF